MFSFIYHIVFQDGMSRLTMFSYLLQEQIQFQLYNVVQLLKFSHALEEPIQLFNIYEASISQAVISSPMLRRCIWQNNQMQANPYGICRFFRNLEEKI